MTLIPALMSGETMPPLTLEAPEAISPESTTTTDFPPRARRKAAVSPVSPDPTIRTSASPGRSDVMFSGLGCSSTQKGVVLHMASRPARKSEAISDT